MNLDEYLEKKKAEAKRHRTYTNDQSLAEQIWEHFHKKLPFARIMRMIKDKGHQRVYEQWNDVRQSDCRNELSLFVYRVKNLPRQGGAGHNSGKKATAKPKNGRADRAQIIPSP